jgi:anti-anti-sigma factor
MLTTFSPAIPLTQFRADIECPSPGVARVTVIGEIDLLSAAALRIRLLVVLFALRPRRIEVDLAGVTFMDCTGLTSLIVASNLAARAGCQLRITSPQPIVRRILDLTGLFDVLAAGFDQVPSGAAAVAAGIRVTA